ncbi:hypothetical protein K469DRAFT_703185 [Zopfia rhizophila CBS 207.26]|uniref:Uncharacterized protein n=1 Tax=Zopfia rhizophila CBS 207.26 TaxID=1314779 RepID=A0A6A6E9G1_9PEZI|nr:hypothetical protein K469DRAFT_703185 [Zopfia rhizophila CBS 207.26]
MNENLKQVFEEATPLSLRPEADDVLDTNTDTLVKVATDEKDNAALFKGLAWKKVPYL